ncbi:MAG: biotin/lipoyl-binding protein, partial [Deltaproteobacteria bacterium]|nr:biotin/lipoyl-binding protein [Deltaproteobacteria bacterium]
MLNSLFLFILALLIILPTCSGEKPKGPPPPVPVAVAAAVKQDVPVQIRTIGAVEPFATVSIKARVGGELKQVNFREGQDVKKGELLFVIDPRTWEA